MGNNASLEESERSYSLPNLSYYLDEPSGASNREVQVNKYMSKQLEKLFLECEICRYTFDLIAHAPKCLSCQHTFCLACLTTMYQRSTDDDRKLTCPKCRACHTWEGDLKDAPNDHKIVKMIDFLSENAKGNKNVCLEHGLQPLKFFCTTCDVPVCKGCVAANHTRSERHTIVNVKTGIGPKISSASQLLTDTEVVLTHLDKRKSSLLDMISNVNVMKEIGDAEIDEVFDKLRLDLEGRKVSLREMLRETWASKKAAISQRRKQLMDVKDVLKSHNTELAAALESNDHTRLCSLLKTSQELYSSVEPMARFDDEDVEPHVAFNIPINLRMVQELKNIGEVENRIFSEEEEEQFQIERLNTISLFYLQMTITCYIKKNDDNYGQIFSLIYIID
ncbi:hypothetical protein Btru_037010 [Bulinus truncatus]|nr:hypothetical protein Btru_037010 [Bulinus truncatus]